MHSRDGLNRIQVLCAGKGDRGGALTEERRGGVIQREREEGRTDNTEDLWKVLWKALFHMFI